MRVLLFALLLLPFNNLYQQNLDSLISKGLEESYNFDFESAIKTFNEIINHNPELPHGYYYLSQINLWFFIGSSDTNYSKAFNNYFEKTKKLCEVQIDLNRDKLESKYYLGAAHVLRSLSLIYAGEYWSAFRSADDGVSLLEDCIGDNPEYYDAYLGIGIIGYTFSFIPSFYKFLIGLFGVPSDKEEAIEYLETASQKGKYTKIESQFYLSKMLNDYSADYDRSLMILKKLSEEFNDNLLIKYQLAITNIHLNNFDNAEENLFEIIIEENERFNQTIALSNMLLGDIYFWRNEFNNALQYYKLFIEKTRSLEYSGYVNFQMALCFSILKNEIEAKKYLLLGRIGNHDIDEDVYAKTKCEYFFENGFSKNLLLLLQVQNYLKIGRIQGAKNILKSDKTELTSSIEKAYSNYLYAELNFIEKKYDHSLNYAEKIAVEDFEIFNWIIPKSFLLRAKIYLALNEFSKAENMLDEVESKNEFEHEKFIQSQITRLRKILQKK